VVQASTYTPVLDNSLIATREELLAQPAGVQAGSKARLLDARPAAFFNGETRHQASRVPGTLKGAQNLEYTRWFAPIPRSCCRLMTSSAWPANPWQPATRRP
jgi:thiosulfate/3-mercaptopyruvate sulfurtransferase